MTRRKPAPDPLQGALSFMATEPETPLTIVTVDGTRKQVQQADIFDVLDAPEAAAEESPAPTTGHYHLHRVNRSTNAQYVYPTPLPTEDTAEAVMEQTQISAYWKDPWVYGWHRCTCETGERALARRPVRSHLAGAPGRNRRCLHCRMNVTAQTHGWQAQFHAPCTDPNGHDGGVN